MARRSIPSEPAPPTPGVNVDRRGHRHRRHRRRDRDADRPLRRGRRQPEHRRGVGRARPTMAGRCRRSRSAHRPAMWGASMPVRTRTLPSDTLDLDGDSDDTEPPAFRRGGAAGRRGQRPGHRRVRISGRHPRARQPQRHHCASTWSTPFDNLTSLREALAYADSIAGADTITFDDSLDDHPSR